MARSGIFSQYKAGNKWISYCFKVLLPVMLVVGIAAATQGCAANKCDCPKFGGQRLKH
jgi:hypothetical protein